MLRRFKGFDLDELRMLSRGFTDQSRSQREVALHDELQGEIAEREEDERLDAETLIGDNAT